ncbi:MAG: DUF92 domain-containing protein [Thermoplasmata archaeon]
MLLSLELAGAGIGVTIVLAAVAVAAGALTRPAGALAAGFGSVIVVLGGFPYLALLALFVLASSLATRYGFEEKKRRKLQEGKVGERGITNVLAHIVIPTSLVIGAALRPAQISPTLLALTYTSAIAFGAADTFASEFGVLSDRARSILTGRPVAVGTNGGVSARGELFALLGAAVTGTVGGALALLSGSGGSSLALLIGGSTAAGFAACQVDSVLGELFENHGYLSKGSVNFLGMLSAVVMAVGLFVAAGGHP